MHEVRILTFLKAFCNINRSVLLVPGRLPGERQALIWIYPLAI